MPLEIAVPKEELVGENRVAMTPSLINKLTALGAIVKVQKNAGANIHAYDEIYKKNDNVKIVDTQKELYKSSNIIIKVQPPTLSEVKLIKDKSIIISFLYPYSNQKLIDQFLAKNITSFAMENIPRISRAQNMDALSSQATIIGYKAVLIAANHCSFFFPMLSTAAGSIRPAKVLIIGAGIAGLQAIATAKRLGAIVSAYDVRPEAKEEVQSLGAKFVETKIAAKGTGGYARELSTQEKQAQQDILKKHISTSDIIITTAGVPGKKAPNILTKEMIETMKPGSVIVDTMAETGGNCELTKMGETINYKNISVIGTVNLPSTLATNASEMYSKNIINFLNLIVQDGDINITWKDEIVSQCCVTHEGKIKNSEIKEKLGE